MGGARGRVGGAGSRVWEQGSAFSETAALTPESKPEGKKEPTSRCLRGKHSRQREKQEQKS